MPKEVREPIQVYLTATERAELDRLAARLGVSRSEVLRRGVTVLQSAESSPGAQAELIAAGILTPARLGPGAPPVSTPVAPLHEILDELRAHREDR